MQNRGSRGIYKSDRKKPTKNKTQENDNYYFSKEEWAKDKRGTTVAPL